MINIFLTGEVGVGKSTVIRKVLAMLPSLTCSGFRTVSTAPGTEGAVFDVYIEKAWEDSPRDRAHLVGKRWGVGRFTACPEAFDAAGVSILASPPEDAGLIIMDELGVMESDAVLFRQTVLNTLDGPLPVLGVIKPRRSAFLDMIRTHGKSKVFEVTKDSRDTLPNQVAELLLTLHGIT